MQWAIHLSLFVGFGWGRLFGMYKRLAPCFQALWPGTARDHLKSCSGLIALIRVHLGFNVLGYRRSRLRGNNGVFSTE